MPVRNNTRIRRSRRWRRACRTSSNHISRLFEYVYGVELRKQLKQYVEDKKAGKPMWWEISNDPCE